MLIVLNINLNEEVSVLLIKCKTEVMPEKL